MIHATVSPATSSWNSDAVPYGTGFQYVANFPPKAIGPQMAGSEGVVMGMGIAGIALVGVLAVGTLALGVYAIKRIAK